MKRKLFFGLASLAIMAAAVTATVSSFTTISAESDLLSQNLEVLTRNEADITCSSNPGSIGQCWIQDGYCCIITGNPNDHCSNLRC